MRRIILIYASTRIHIARQEPSKVLCPEANLFGTEVKSASRLLKPVWALCCLKHTVAIRCHVFNALENTEQLFVPDNILVIISDELVELVRVNLSCNVSCEVCVEFKVSLIHFDELSHAVKEQYKEWSNLVPPDKASKR